MIKVKDKNWNQLKVTEKIAYCKDNLIDPALDERRKYDWKWYLAKRFQAGDHYVQYNVTTNTLENPPRKRGAVRLVINFIKAHTRAVKNFITSSNPKFEILPGDLDEKTLKNAKRAGGVLDYLHRKILYLFSKIRIAIDDIVDVSVAFFELGWDENAANGKGQVTLTTHDPFEIIIPLTAQIDGSVIHAPFIAKAIPRDLSEIHNDPKYNEKTRKEVKPDDELAASEQKRKILRREGRKSERPEGQQTAMVYEVMLWDTEGNDKKGNMNVYTFSGDQELRDEETDLKEFPIYVLQDEPRRHLYSESPLTWTLIPAQKGINRLESQKLENNNNILRTRILVEKGHGINFSATGKAGTGVEVLEVNPGRNAQFWKSDPISDGGQSDRLVRYLEVMSGVHEAMFGINPAGGRSGEMLEQLQAAGANNLAGFQMSLVTFLETIGSRILDIVADKFVASRIMKITEAEGEGVAKVVGANGPDLEDAVIINEDNEVIVTIGSYLGYTKGAQRKTLTELQERGIIPAEEVLKQLDFPNVDATAAKAREERLEEHELKAEIAGRREGAATPEGQAPMGQAAVEAPDVGLADDENARMMAGEILPPTQNASLQHTQAHVDFLQSPDIQENPDTAVNIRVHAQGEIEQQGIGG